jgi:hypothetical protein
MKQDIHPKYEAAHIVCACGNRLPTRTTKGDLSVEIRTDRILRDWIQDSASGPNLLHHRQARGRANNLRRFARELRPHRRFQDSE